MISYYWVVYIGNRSREAEAARVKGRMSLRNDMWHGVWDGIIMRNMIYAGNKLTEEGVLFSRQFYKSSSLIYSQLP